MAYIIIGIVAALLVLCLIIAYFLYTLAFNPHFDKSRIFGGGNIELSDDHEDDVLLKNPGNDVFIRSDDGLRLHALFVEQQNRSGEATSPWVIAVHGYTGQAQEMGFRAAGFYHRGYNMLLPDNRGHGQSEGNYIGMGWHDRLDILKWIEYLNREKGASEIILFGVSMGAATVMMTAGEPLPDNVRCIIEDCGYTSVKDEMTYEGKYLFHTPYFPLIWMASGICKLKAGYSFTEASAVTQLAKATKPMMFIHGGNDRFVPTYMVDTLYDTAQVKKRKLIIEGAGHAESFEVNKELYWKEIFDFLDCCK